MLSPAGAAFHPHDAAHQFAETLADRQPEPGTAVFARRGRIDLTEGTEQSIDAVRRNSNSGVAHREFEDGDVGLRFNR
jgi:hypothetical protein